MKRYVVEGNVIDTRNIVGFGGERLFVDLADLQARDLRLAELARALPHEYMCSTRLPGNMVGGISFDVNKPPYAHEAKHKCDCPRGELLAMLGETTNG
jgi:hypothetical protein